MQGRLRSAAARLFSGHNCNGFPAPPGFLTTPHTPSASHASSPSGDWLKETGFYTGRGVTVKISEEGLPPRLAGRHSL
ncbi:hypothetical protein DO233_13090 [Salmonella enterica]|nr:hypothetical protein [Salmonella enterica]EBJ1006215.1 hypothetical protein [Salmonella enterica]EBJ1200343.1 hypothetical protein [Salmonella enterica]EBN9019112.1 hypothetical protein [Salmonella enterica]